MFENVLTSYPGRLDLWSIYLDKTIAQSDHEQTRYLTPEILMLYFGMYLFLSRINIMLIIWLLAQRGDFITKIIIKF